MSWNGKFKYDPMNQVKWDSIIEKCDDDIKQYINELYELIHYQKEMINAQRIEIIALKHKKSWAQYDKQKEE